MVVVMMEEKKRKTERRGEGSMDASRVCERERVEDAKPR